MNYIFYVFTVFTTLDVFFCFFHEASSEYILGLLPTVWNGFIFGSLLKQSLLLLAQ